MMTTTTTWQLRHRRRRRDHRSLTHNRTDGRTDGRARRTRTDRLCSPIRRRWSGRDRNPTRASAGSADEKELHVCKCNDCGRATPHTLRMAECLLSSVFLLPRRAPAAARRPPSASPALRLPPRPSTSESRVIDRAECKQIRRPLALAASFPADSAAGTVAGAATARGQHPAPGGVA